MYFCLNVLCYRSFLYKLPILCFKSPHIPRYHLTEVKFHYKTITILAQNVYNCLYTDMVKQNLGVKDQVDIITHITILLGAY